MSTQTLIDTYEKHLEANWTREGYKSIPHLVEITDCTLLGQFGSMRINPYPVDLEKMIGEALASPFTRYSGSSLGAKWE